MNELIRVTQLPVIEERLRTMKEDMERVTAEATEMICTPETIASVKSTRAELRKRFEWLEAQRKAVKQAVMDPYYDFEKVYKECVSVPICAADKALKEKIQKTEEELRDACEKGLREFFEELRQACGVPWLSYEQVGLKVDLASAKAKTPSKLRRQMTDFVERVAEEARELARAENADEVLAVYQRTLNAVEAMATVRARKQAVEEARRVRERLEAKAEQEKAAEEAARQAAADRPPEILPPPTTETEEKVRCTFSVTATVEQLKKLKNFLETEEIPYE